MGVYYNDIFEEVKIFLTQRQLLTTNMCMQQTLNLPSNISLENPSKIDSFSKLSKREIV